MQHYRHLNPADQKSMSPENMADAFRSASRPTAPDAMWQFFLFSKMWHWILAFLICGFVEFGIILCMAAGHDCFVARQYGAALIRFLAALAGLPIFLWLAFIALRRCAWLTRIFWIVFLFWPFAPPLMFLALPALGIEIIALFWRWTRGISSGGSENH
jgi:hypothetical protein